MSQSVLISWLLVVAHVLIVLVAAVLISANRKPSTAIAWIIAIIFIPVLGITFFLLTGSANCRVRAGISSVKCAKRSWRVPTAWTDSVIASNGPTGWPRW